MLRYTYVARNPASGERVTATVEADSEQSAAKLIRSEGLVPVEIRVSKSGGDGFFSRFNRIKAKDRVIFSRQLATLLNAGLPLVQSLRNVNNQTESKKLKLVISHIITDVEAGSPLAKAMGKYPDVFNAVYINLIAAGEASGTLDRALERLADQQEKDADIVSKVRGAMIYPLIVLVVMGAVVLFMLVKVLPQVKTLYSETHGASLPFITVVLLDLSDFVIKWWWAVAILLVIMGVFTGRWTRTIGGRRVTDKLKMRVWPIGSLFMKLYMARFARTGTTLVASGVPLIQMLNITARAVDNVYIEDSINRATEKVKAGKSLGQSLTNDPNFLELVPNMLKIGEQSGSMEQMLGKAADYYEKELDNEIKAIQTIIEPVMMIVMGLVAFTIVAAVLLPIYNLASNIGGSV
jgi:type II secretory pathway component PulF